MPNISNGFMAQPIPVFMIQNSTSTRNLSNHGLTHMLIFFKDHLGDVFERPYRIVNYDRGLLLLNDGKICHNHAFRIARSLDFPNIEITFKIKYNCS